MHRSLTRTLVCLSLVTAGSVAAQAQVHLTLDPHYLQADAADYPDSIPIGDAPDAHAVEVSINQALAQVEDLISDQYTFQIRFVDDETPGSLGSSVGTNTTDIAYSQVLTDMGAELHKTADFNTALADLPAGPRTGINSNATQVALGGSNLIALGDQTDGRADIQGNGGYICTIGLNLSIMNITRTNIDPTKYDLISTVTHEVDEALGIGGQGSTLGNDATDVGMMDLYRFSASGVRSYSTSGNVSSYFSINDGKTDLVHFNQLAGGDYGDWGDGVIPADGQGNNPAQVQDAFGGTSNEASPNMGRNEAIALNAVGWKMTAAGLSLEGATVSPTSSSGLATPAGVSSGLATPGGVGLTSVPEPGECVSLLLGGMALIGLQRRRRAA
jgi:hypothetical protein